MSTLKSLREAVMRHASHDEHELEMQAILLTFMDIGEKVLHRSFEAGHITASAWVLDPASRCVLLIHHRKLDKWLQPGGHADGSADTLAVAQREVWEETGLETEPIFPEIFDIDIHEIPARGSEKAHFHYDLRYILRPKAGSQVRPNHEVFAAEWVDVSEVHLRNDESSVMRMVKKSAAYLDPQPS